MNDSYIQNLRYKLQRRVRRLNGIGDGQRFHNQLSQFLVWLDNEPMVRGILDRLELDPKGREVAAWLAQDERSGRESYQFEQMMKFSSDAEEASACYLTLKKFASKSDNMPEYKTAMLLLRKNDVGEGLSFFWKTFIEPLYDYINEHLDDTGAILALLRRYKQRCEWFHRKRLLETFEKDTGKGEENLAYDAYEYLFDQGLELYIEPESPAGRPDMVSAEIGAERLIADAKIFDPDRSKPKYYLIKGFRQIYDYAAEHNSPVGFLLIFKTCEKDLHLSLTGAVSGTPYVIHNNRTFFFMVVDLFAYQQSASKRGQLAAVELTADELVSAVEDISGEDAGEGTPDA
jgi:hypothetical protein